MRLNGGLMTAPLTITGRRTILKFSGGRALSPSQTLEKRPCRGMTRRETEPAGKASFAGAS